MGKYLFKQIEKVDVDNFVQSQHFQSSPQFSTLSLGLFVHNELVLILQIGTVKTSAALNSCSMEIYSLLAKDPFVREIEKTKLIRFYIENYNPADFLFSENTPGYSENLCESLNMEKITDEKGKSYYEWVNQQYTFYTYRITATDSEKYYYGVSHLKTANASVQDCLDDGYFGSGGKKFQNWKEKHRNSLRKEIIGVHQRKSKAYFEERTLISDSYRKDSNCLNSRPGGELQPPIRKTIQKKNCPEHGEANHNGSTCLRCSVKSRYSEELCNIHGLTSHHGGNCQKCSSIALKSVKECPIHGSSKHQGNQCYLCMRKGEIANCQIHGETNHFGGRCMVCANEDTIEVKHCFVHGETKHHGEKCYQCITSKSVTLKTCTMHGETKHRGNFCFKCRANNVVISEKQCEKHGLSKHQGNRCVKCSRGAVVLKNCKIHGETKHRGDACFKCAAAKRTPKRK